MIKNGVTVACFGRRYREAVKQCSLQDRIWMKILQALPVLAVYCLSITMGAGGGLAQLDICTVCDLDNDTYQSPTGLLAPVGAF